MLLPAALSLGACGTAGAESPAPSAQAPGTIWQVSPFALLVRGSYDGVMPVGAARRHGDLGLGAADQLAGEMALVDGRWYQFLEGGRAVVPPDEMRTPFAEVTFWSGGRDIAVQPGARYDASKQLQDAVDAQLPTLNAFYALRLEGTWDVVMARTYLRQTRPYPPLGQAAADTITLTAVSGTMVGFRAPSYADSLGVPGYHLHFVTADRSRGGHVISFTAREVRMQASERPEFTLRMPPPPAAP
jgi:acetolactate decarboxylase